MMELYSSRLKLRLIDSADLNAIHILHSLAETDEFNALGIPEDIGETSRTIDPWIVANKEAEIQSYTFAIEESNTNQFIGLFGLKLGAKKYRRGEVWYKLHLDHWGKGFGTEALNRVLDFGFDDLNLHRIQAGCAVDNMGSIKVLEKAGMLREGRGRQLLPLKSGWSDNFEYAILETDERKKA
ncbi:GNAT family N-acetyltransferase [Flavobacterium frigoris]|uniref:Protein N-acetyltransferase, RimJ/RimL family n=1 Tax=Flavobacterium frigoris TaxID=229204 RepID=A0A1H9KQ62_FLAFI|nr:GNAT family N-acetyltransferase [Flavobacterium frigoris]SER01321.1 Protein N-acetyltransferase, RimJ/RimL family [Flavobacterium frigoris]